MRMQLKDYALRKKISMNLIKKISIISLWPFIMAAIGGSAFVSGVFFALPPHHKDFARVEFLHTSVAAEIADTPHARRKGLSGRASLAESGGMLFVADAPEYTSIWMKDMNFPIDILWIANGKVIDMKERVQPSPKGLSDHLLPIYSPVTRSDFVLEVNAGFSDLHAINIGDQVNITLDGNTYVYPRIYEDRETDIMSENSPLPPIGHEYTIDTLRKKTLQGSNFFVGDRIAANAAYETRAITYTSGDLTISGVMNIPHGQDQAKGFPVLILNHGLISPSIYTSGRGSKREQDFFARHGYVTIHPDYRGHASSSPDVSVHHDFYVGYTQDVTSLIDALKKSSLPYIDTNRIGMWGHSMGGGIATRAMVVRSDIKAFVLFAPISADVEDNFYELTPEEIEWLHTTYGPAGTPIYRAISAIEYFNDIASPVQIHHGINDTAVPLFFSEKIYETLKRLKKPVEFFVYADEEHEFIDQWPLVINRALQFFDHYVKEE